MSQLAPSDINGNYIRPVSSMSLSDNETNTDLTAMNNDDQLVLFVGYACPWCHRVQLALALTRRLHEQKQKLGNVHTVIVQPSDSGLWRFATTGDTDCEVMESSETVSDIVGVDITKMTYLKDLYLQVDPSYSGRFTAPLLYNATRKKLISNESSQILNLLIPSLSPSSPSSSSSVIITDEQTLCDTIHADINDGVYKVGFATSQQAYNLAADRLFHALDTCENLLSQTNGFLLSEDTVSRADVMLFPTVFRFDTVYAPLFRITRRSIAGDYPLLGAWMRRVYHLDQSDGGGIKQSCGRLETIVEHYFSSLFPFNASGIVPQTRDVDLSPLP